MKSGYIVRKSGIGVLIAIVMLLLPVFCTGEALAGDTGPALGSTKLSYQGLDPITLYDDMVIDSNMNLKKKVDLNGHTLTVHGNLIQSDDTVTINGGRLIIDGDYIIGNYFTDDEGRISDFFWCSANLVMNDPDDYVSVGGSFKTYSETHDNIFAAGTLEVKGDFAQYYAYSFMATGTKVILSGQEKQHIHFNAPGWNGFFDLVLENTDVEVDSELSGWTLTQDITFGNGLPNGLLDNMVLNGHTMTVNGDVEIRDINNTDSVFRLDKGTLEISGRLIQQGGTVDISGGSMLIGGDYIIGQYFTDDEGRITEFYWCYANLVMDDPDDYVSVGGSFETNSKAENNIYSAGTMEVKGDFAQYYAGSFMATGTKVILSGQEKQHIHFTSPEWNGFFDLVLENTDVEADTALRGWTLTQDITFGNGLPNGLLDNMVLNGHTMTVNGDVEIRDINNTDSVFRLDKGTLEISGRLIQQGGTVDISGGSMLIGGDYIIGQYFTDDEGRITEFYWCYANLVMDDPDDYVSVGGSFETNSKAENNIYSAGTMEVKGDFAQYYAGSFMATGTKVILSGQEKQHIHFTSPEWNGFFDLVLENTDVEADTALRGWTLTQDVTFGNGLPNGLLDNMALNGHTMTVDGDLDIRDINYTDSVFHLDNGTLKVSGDLIHQAGTISVDDGTLWVEKDYVMAQWSKQEDGSRPSDPDDYLWAKGNLIMTSDKGSVYVKGNLYADCENNVSNSSPDDDMILTAGTMYVTGNFYQGGGTALSFPASDKHVVVLDGTGPKQIVKMARYPSSKFATLKLTRDIGFYEIDPEVCWDTIITN